MTSESSDQAAQKGEENEEETGTPVDCFKSKEAFSGCCFGYNNYWKAMVAMGVLVAYLLLGGFFFFAVERPNEMAKVEQVQLERLEARQALDEFRKTLDRYFANLTNRSETREGIRNRTDILIELAKRVAVTSRTIRAERDPTWDYASSVFFASTVVTTIGYGTIAPETSGGQILFIFFSLIGIPLALILLTTIGSIMSDWVNALLTPLVKHCTQSKIVARAMGTLTIVLVTLIFFIFVPAAIFTVVEAPNGWTYLISIYYCFVSLTTVGFGDYVPGILGSTISDNRGVIGLYRIMTSVWVWIGLALVATLISEIQDLIGAIGKAIHERAKQRKKILFSLHKEDTPVASPEHATVQTSDKLPVLCVDQDEPGSPGENAESAAPEMGQMVDQS